MTVAEQEKQKVQRKQHLVTEWLHINQHTELIPHLTSEDENDNQNSRVSKGISVSFINKRIEVDSIQEFWAIS